MENKEYSLSYFQRFDIKKLVYPNKICKWFKFRGRLVDDTRWERINAKLKPNDFNGIKNINKVASIIHTLYPNTNCFQLEEGSYPTSYIACSNNIPTTRTADYVHMDSNGKVDLSNHRGIIKTDKYGKKYLVTEPQRTNYITKQPKDGE
jgi:hypothetical protein